jgi:hypothetical protein
MVKKNGGQLDDSEMLRNMMMPVLIFYAIQQVEVKKQVQKAMCSSMQFPKNTLSTPASTEKLSKNILGWSKLRAAILIYLERNGNQQSKLVCTCDN